MSKSLIATPKQSLLIPPLLIKDTRLNWAERALYGKLRRINNLSLHHISHFYDKTRHILYIIAQVKTLMNYIHTSNTTITKYMNDLEKYGYIERFPNYLRHTVEIRLPLAEKYYQISIPYEAPMQHRSEDSSSRGSEDSSSRGSEDSSSRCKEQIYKDHNFKDQSFVTGNGQQPKQTWTEKQKQSWIKNTHNNLGLPLSVVQLIASYNHSSKNASYTVKTIVSIKNALNAQYSGVYYSDYYKNETNPYIQNGGLLNSLKNVFTNNKELQVVITDDYTNVLKSSELNSRTAKKSNHKLSKNTKDLLKDDKQYDKEYEKHRQPTSNKEIKKLELSQAEDNINNYGLSVKPEKFVKIQNGILKKLKNKNKNVDECNLNGKAIKLTVKHIQNKTKPKQHKHGFGHPVDINTGKSIDTQDNSRDAHKSKQNTPKKSTSKPLNHKSNTNTQSDTKMNDSSTHKKNKDTAVGRKTELSKLRDEYNRIADDKKFKEIHSKMVNNKDTTKAERKFCINKSQRLTPITNKIQKIKR